LSSGIGDNPSPNTRKESMTVTGVSDESELVRYGLRNLKSIFWNSPPATLIEQAIFRQEGVLSSTGSLVVKTGACTGRSPRDKYIIDHGASKTPDIWWGENNQPFSAKQFEGIYRKVKAYLQGRDLFIQDLFIGADPVHRLPIRVLTETAWQNLFAWNIFIRPSIAAGPGFKPEFTVISCPGLLVEPEEDGTRSSTAILLDFESKTILICGTAYAGEIKKAIFTVLNFILPQQDILSMHCSANTGKSGRTALFFGLSGTGKTTLSSTADRRLIGDDEHGWGDNGVFNFEGGCYAKTIHLSPQLEPFIWQAAQRFGAVLENVVLDPQTRLPDYNDDCLTENGRAAYPIHFIPHHVPEGTGGHPDVIFFLSADAFGILPPIARLTPEQALYFFLSGYTAKLAGTERDLGREPVATFSACFSAPFLPLPPYRYARLLAEKIVRYEPQVWLINTGWTGGPYGAGHRIHLNYTHAMVKAALDHLLDDTPLKKLAYGLYVPETCPGVPPEILDPIRTWPNPQQYQIQAQLLAGQFKQNFSQFNGLVPEEVRLAGPN